MRIKAYDPHPCLRCNKTTTGKTYCKPCLDFVKRPQYTFPAPELVPHAKCDGKSGRRNESIHTLRG